MAEWSFLTNHARAVVCIARDPGVRLREIAAALEVTERRAFGIVTDLANARYVVKEGMAVATATASRPTCPGRQLAVESPRSTILLEVLLGTRTTECAREPDDDA